MMSEPYAPSWLWNTEIQQNQVIIRFSSSENDIKKKLQNFTLWFLQAVDINHPIKKSSNFIIRFIVHFGSNILQLRSTMGFQCQFYLYNFTISLKLVNAAIVLKLSRGFYDRTLDIVWRKNLSLKCWLNSSCFDKLQFRY